MKTNPQTAVMLVGGIANFNGFSISPSPKALLPIANRPLYYYLEKSLAAVGVKRIIFCVKPEVTELVTQRLALHIPEVDYLVRETTFGSAGSIREVEDCLGGEPFWLVNGELLMGIDLAPLLVFHQEREVQATVAVMPVLEAAWEKERVELDAQKEVKVIHRIHPAQERRSMLRPAGLYLFEPEVLEYIPPNSYFDLKEQLFPILYEKGGAAVTWEITGYSRTISSLDDYFFANLDVLLGRVDLPALHNSTNTNGTNHQNPPHLDSSVKLYPPYVVRPETQIGSEAVILGPTAIGQGCEVEPNCIINECVILDQAKIGQGTYLSRCIVGEGTLIRKGSILYETALHKGANGSGETQVLHLREPSHREAQAVSKHLQWKTPAGPFYLKIKRLLDIFLSTLFLMITAPFMLIIALAVKLDSPGPILFRQERSGLGGCQFTMYKFRSMVSNAEEIKRELLEMNEVDGPMFKILKDPRITRLGKFLRDTNLDELPQLLNILRGDMSLVGPRPLSFDEMRYNPRWRDARLAVRPGMTGLWQVEAHTKLEFNEWIRQDLDYVHNISLGLDLNILYRTLKKAFLDLIHTLAGRRK
jgi:lipopolysaccharide/colanic/teichoic acid biosynthesis glycosyltransferase/NDP-sugar pyrophosphorylase family protein